MKVFGFGNPLVAYKMFRVIHGGIILVLGGGWIQVGDVRCLMECLQSKLLDNFQCQAPARSTCQMVDFFLFSVNLGMPKSSV